MIWSREVEIVLALALAGGLWAFLRWLARPDVVAEIWREVERIDRERD